MDDSPIQTALCVIGHPIGGNPTQFVAQRALAALGLDWQFMSFDVPPEKIEKAIGGVDSLGFCGAMIAAPYQTQVAKILLAGRPAGEPAGDAESLATAEPADTAQPSTIWHDCLYRDNANTLLASNVYAAALRRLIAAHGVTIAAEMQQGLLIGDVAKRDSQLEPLASILPTNCLVAVGAKLVSWPVVVPEPPRPPVIEATAEVLATPVSSSDSMVDAPVLVIWALEGKPSKKPNSKSSPQSPAAPFVMDLLSRLHSRSLLIDLSGSASAWLAASREENTEPITVISNTELEINRLAIAIQHWTGHEPNIESMREAIEEYLEI